MNRTSDLATSVGTRICHDIISPLGAIGNGLELLELTGVAGPEVDLILQSVASASARLRAFRLAFGPSDLSQPVPREELAEILEGYFAGERFGVDWQGARNLTRDEAKGAILGLLCLETALPHGGRLELESSDGIVLRGHGEATCRDAACWDLLSGGRDRADHVAQPEPAQIHFAMLGAHLDALRRTPKEAWGPEGISLAL